MDLMFNQAVSFNQNISSWNTTSVTNISYMFNNAVLFEQNKTALLIGILQM